MALSVPTYIQDQCYSANDLRLAQGGIVCQDGVEGFEVHETNPQSGSIRVRNGHAWLDGLPNSEEGGRYHVSNDGDIELEVPLNSTGSTRDDSVWIRICDTDFSIDPSGAELVYMEDDDVAPSDGCIWYQLAKVHVTNGAGEGGTNITEAMIEWEAQPFELCGDPWLTATEELDFGSINGGTSAALTITVEGAEIGMPVIWSSIVPAFSSSLITAARVSATDTVTCQVYNISGGALNPSPSDWTVSVKSR